MRYCYNCGRITSGEPKFCTFCRRTYNVKLCPRLHFNPREAHACSECGSPDLTTPQPRLPFWLRPLLFLISVLPGLLLLLLSTAFLIAYVYILFARPDLQLLFMILGLGLGLLWLLYMELPVVVRSQIRRRIKR
jgi:RNA polymerase subunit RPABC4/transcription elongation factor Spt4